MTTTLQPTLLTDITGEPITADISHHSNEKTGSEVEPARPTSPLANEDVAICELCRHRGTFGKDVIDAAYIDGIGHESVRCECRNIEACLNRRGF